MEPMVHAWSAAQVRAAEEPHLDAGEPLMARASAGLAEGVRGLLRASSSWPAPVVLLVGSGSNGGDALFAGALLAADGCPVTVVPTGSRVHEEGLEAARDAGAVVDDPVAWSTADGAARRLAETGAAVLLDGVVGTGTSGSPALRGAGRRVVEALLASRDAGRLPLVVAVDLPSGVGPDDGSVPDDAVLPADLTVTFGGRKAGLVLAPGSALAGRVEVVEIGIEADLAAMPPLSTLPD